MNQVILSINLSLLNQVRELKATESGCLVIKRMSLAFLHINSAGYVSTKDKKQNKTQMAPSHVVRRKSNISLKRKEKTIKKGVRGLIIGKSKVHILAELSWSES